MLNIFQYILLFFLFASTSLLAQQDDEEPLMPEEAFRANIVSITTDHINVQWKIAEGYYLYRDKFKFSAEGPDLILDKADIPRGKIKQDEFFGNVETFRKQVTVSLPYTNSGATDSIYNLTIRSQGCADIGLCYPPYTQKLVVNLKDITTQAVDVVNNTTTDQVAIAPSKARCI